MKKTGFIFGVVTFLALSLFSLLTPSNSFAAACTATATPSVVSGAGQPITVNITFSPAPHIFTWKFDGPGIAQTDSKVYNSPPTQTNFQLNITSIPNSFTGVQIFYQPVIPTGDPPFSCTAPVTNSAAPPASTPCTFSFSPATIEGGQPVTVTVFNSQGSTTTARIDAIGNTVTSTGGTVSTTITAPAAGGSYNVAVSWFANIGNTGTCSATGASTINVSAAPGGGGAPSGPVPTIPLPDGPTITGIPNASGLPGALITLFFPLILVLLGFVAIYYIVVSAIRFTISRGNPEVVAEARSRLIWAVVGFIILILAYAILVVFDTMFLRSNVVA